MKSKTSFFNAGLFKSNLKRFWPLWTAHFVCWFIALPVIVLLSNFEGNYYSNSAIMMLSESTGFVSTVIAFIVALLSAMAMNSFMYTNRSTGLIASLPIKREAVFGSAYLAGLLPIVASNLIIAALTFVCSLGSGAELGLVFKAALIWFAVYSMEFVVFYGIATVIAMMTGSLVVLPVLYVIFNFLLIGMEQIVRMFLSYFVWGMENYSVSALLEFTSPVFFLGNNVNIIAEYTPVITTGNVYGYEKCIGLQLESWSVLLIYFAVGLALSAIALMMLRKRKMESSGDVIAVPCLRPVFKYGVAVCAALSGGLLLFVIFSSFFDVRPAYSFIMIPCMIVCALIGYFGSEMLLKKSFHVFRGGWTGFIVLACLCAVFTLCCDLDVFGIGKIVPDADDVECVDLFDAGEISNPDVIADTIELHKEIVNDSDRYTDNYSDCYHWVRFQYKLKDGSYFVRQYSIADDENYQKYRDIVSSPEVQLELFTPAVPVTVEHCTGGYFYFDVYDAEGNSVHDYSATLSPEQAVDFYHNALIPDIMAGNKVIDYDRSGYYASVEIYFVFKVSPSTYETVDYEDSLFIDITSECTNCLQWLKDNLGVDIVTISAENAENGN